MVTSNTVLALMAAVFAGSSAALGINCRGSGLCVGNKGILGEAQGQLRALDPNKQFSDGEHITCTKSSVTIGNPSLCLFYQNTGGRKWTVAQTQRYVQQLIDHGCSGCGSVPTDPGNNVQNGQLTANMVTNARRSLDMVAKMARRDEVLPRNPQPVNQVEDSKALLERALGINCRGSSTCTVGGIGHSPAGTLEQIRDAVAAGPDGSWGNGQQIACVAHVTGRLCAFYQNIGNRQFNKQQSVAFLDQLRDHGCRVCGSIPTDPGNNVGNGQLTVNFVA